MIEKVARGDVGCLVDDRFSQWHASTVRSVSSRGDQVGRAGVATPLRLGLSRPPQSGVVLPDSIDIMWRGALVWLATLPAAVAMLAPAGASACPCHEFCGRVVAHGSSLHGVPWRAIAATRSSGEQNSSIAEVAFSIHACGEYSEAGYSMGFLLPFATNSFLSANLGTDIDSYPESDLSGVTSRSIVKLTLTMSKGSPLSVYPSLAPRRMWRSLPWLRQLRFFAQFFPAGTAPLEVTAFDRAGHVLVRRKPKFGSFS